jgi:hypothetical protein
MITQIHRRATTDGEHDADEPLDPTPGGPRSGDTVHPVEPGQRLRQLPDGTYVVEPNPQRGGGDGDPENQAR